MQWVLAIREKVVIKPSRLSKCRGTPLQFPHLCLALIHTSLSGVLKLQASGLADSITRKERSCCIYTSHTHCQASLMVSRYTTLFPPLRLCMGPAREAGLSTGTWRGHVPHRKRKKERKKASSSSVESWWSICMMWLQTQSQTEHIKVYADYTGALSAKHTSDVWQVHGVVQVSKLYSSQSVEKTAPVEIETTFGCVAQW